jgi:hypothetical protein
MRAPLLPRRRVGSQVLHRPTQSILALKVIPLVAEEKVRAERAHLRAECRAGAGRVPCAGRARAT